MTINQKFYLTIVLIIFSFLCFYIGKNLIFVLLFSVVCLMLSAYYMPIYQLKISNPKGIPLFISIFLCVSLIEKYITQIAFLQVMDVKLLWSIKFIAFILYSLIIYSNWKGRINHSSR